MQDFTHEMGILNYVFSLSKLLSAIKKLCTTDNLPDVTCLSRKGMLEEDIFFLRLQQLIDANYIDIASSKEICMIRLEQLFDAIEELCTIDRQSAPTKRNFRHHLGEAMCSRGLFFIKPMYIRGRGMQQCINDTQDLALNSLTDVVANDPGLKGNITLRAYVT